MEDYKNSIVRLTENGVTYRWNVSTLWEASRDGQIEIVPVSSFDNELEDDRWFKNYVRPTVKNIMKHIKRTIDTDLEFPIIVSPNGSILDGIHRLVKAKLIGLETIKIIHLKTLPASDFSDDQVFQSSKSPL